MNSETVKIFMLDGVITGIVTAEIMNWTGSIVSSSLSSLERLTIRPELKRSGCYVLLSSEKVYIGESETIVNRWKDPKHPITSGDYERVIVITSKDANLTKAHIKYLEARLIELASRSKKLQLANGTSQQRQLENLPESDTADMENFLEKLLVIMPALGIDTFNQPVLLKQKAETANMGSAVSEISPIFFYKGNGFEAQAQFIDGQFIVLKGSQARYIWGSENTQRKIIRDTLINNGVLLEIGTKVKHYVFTQDYEFNSPSIAAVVVGGINNVSGPAVWKMDNQLSYKLWIEEKLK